MTDRLTLGFSPCPNDTFMFGALVNGLVDTGTFGFDTVIEDVESLNQRALAGELDVTKLSVSAYAFASGRYGLLQSGSALGRRCGPLLVSRPGVDTTDMAALRLAIPGRYTTANLLTGIFFPEAKQKTEMIFSAIEDAVASGACDVGAIIHESRFTYERKGLVAVADLGRLWEERMHPLLPLGCVAAKRSLPPEKRRALDRLLHAAIRHAFDHPDTVMPFVRAHADTMDAGVMQRHIALYVNEFSLALTAEARDALMLLFDTGFRHGLLPRLEKDPFAA